MKTKPILDYFGGIKGFELAVRNDIVGSIFQNNRLHNSKAVFDISRQEAPISGRGENGRVLNYQRDMNRDNWISKVFLVNPACTSQMFGIYVNKERVFTLAKNHNPMLLKITERVVRDLVSNVHIRREYIDTSSPVVYNVAKTKKKYPNPNPKKKAKREYLADAFGQSIASQAIDGYMAQSTTATTAGGLGGMMPEMAVWQTRGTISTRTGQNPTRIASHASLQYPDRIPMSIWIDNEILYKLQDIAHITLNHNGVTIDLEFMCDGAVPGLRNSFKYSIPAERMTEIVANLTATEEYMRLNPERPMFIELDSLRKLLEMTVECQIATTVGGGL